MPSIHLIMRSNVDQDDTLLMNDKFQGDTIAGGDGNGMQPVQFAGKRVESQRWMKRV